MTGLDERLGKLLSFDDAMTLLDDLAAAGHEVLGADGFRMRADGKREALLDLLIDVSGETNPIPLTGRVPIVRAFIIDRNGPDIAWEIW